MPYVQAGDIKLHYIEHGEGNEPLVFVHGYTGSLRDWEHILPRLPAGFRGLAFDSRGAGESDRPGHGYNISQYAEDIYLAAHELELGAFTLIGHSLGGGVGMQLALEHPEQLRRLVLVAPIPSDGIEPIDTGMQAQMKLLRQNKELFKMMARTLLARPFADEQLDRSFEDSQKWQDDAYDQAAESAQSIRLGDKLGDISVPTLMVVGDRDFQRADNLNDAQRIPNCALQVFYRAGHMVQFDVPDQFVDVLFDFIEYGPGTPMPLGR